MPAEYFLNLNYICNEKCVFCAADVVGITRVEGHPSWVSLDEVRAWLGETLPGPDDQVMLAGGEPTLHKELLPIVELLARNCRNVTLFTNGLRLVDPAYARAVVDAGITRFEIALFGATAATHDAITKVRGSFERTLDALNILAGLRPERTFVIALRLLVSRQSSPENAAIVRVVHERAPGIDIISLNRLIFSRLAADTNSTISWEEARASINETASLARTLGYELEYLAVPLCVFEGANAEFVRQRHRIVTRRLVLEPGSEPSTLRYFDPMMAAGQKPEHSSLSPLPILKPCVCCDYAQFCGRVEDWYVEEYGAAGLRTVKLAEPLGSAVLR